MTTFDSTDISNNVAWDEAISVRKSVKKNLVSEASLSVRFACQTFLLACSHRGAYSQAGYNVDTS